MKIKAEIDIPNINPETLAHAQHVLDQDTKYRDYTIKVVEAID